MDPSYEGQLLTAMSEAEEGLAGPDAGGAGPLPLRETSVRDDLRGDENTPNAHLDQQSTPANGHLGEGRLMAGSNPDCGAEVGLVASDVQTRGPIQRALLLTSGALLTMVAVIGLFLPILPTTPFLILAAGCFARSSPAMYRALLANKSFGHLLAQWQSNRSIPAGAKVKAYSLILVSFSISIYLVEPVGLRLILGCLGAALLLFLKRLPSATR